MNEYTIQISNENLEAMAVLYYGYETNKEEGETKLQFVARKEQERIENKTVAFQKDAEIKAVEAKYSVKAEAVSEEDVIK